MSKAKKLSKPKKLNNWFEYDWQFEGADALFGVDQDFFSELDKHGKSLITMVCTSKHNELKISELKAYERAKNSIVNIKKKGLNISYVGFIETMNIVRYYFYTDNCDNLGVLENMFKAHKRIALIAGKTRSTAFTPQFYIPMPQNAIPSLTESKY